MRGGAGCSVPWQAYLKVRPTDIFRVSWLSLGSGGGGGEGRRGVGIRSDITKFDRGLEGGHILLLSLLAAAVSRSRSCHCSRASPRPAFWVVMEKSARLKTGLPKKNRASLSDRAIHPSLGCNPVHTVLGLGVKCIEHNVTYLRVSMHRGCAISFIDKENGRLFVEVFVSFKIG